MIEGFESINLILLVSINFIGFFVAFWVYFADRKKKINQLVFFWAFFSLMYINFGYLSELSVFINYSLILKKLRFLAVSLFFITGYFFYLYFPQKSRRNLYLERIYISLWLLTAFFSLFTSYIIKEVYATEDGVNVIFGSGIKAFFLLTILSIILLFTILFKKYFKLSKNEKLQVQYFLVGASLFALFNLVFNIFFPLYRQDMKYYQIGDYSTMFLMGFTAYAIVKRELFGIKIVLTQALVIILAFLLLFQAILASSIEWKIVNSIALVLFISFGLYLIKAVKNEEERRRKAEEVAKEEKELRKKSEKLIKEFERLSKAKNQFVMATQHHLRTPLTTMRGYLDLIFGGTYGKVPKKLKKTLERFEASTVRLIRTINEFLDISQFQIGKEVVSLKPESRIDPILEEMKEELSFQAEDKGIKLKVKKPKKPLPTIKADVEKLKAAFFNIADNAIKYTQKGSVTITAEALDSKIRVYIKDTGMGLSKEEQETLFSRLFERGEEAKKAFSTGRGIGLYLSYQIVKAHKGKLWAESEGPGKGSTFIFELPVER